MEALSTMVFHRLIAATASLSCVLCASFGCDAEDAAPEAVLSARVALADDATPEIVADPVDVEACQRVVDEAIAYLDTVMPCTTDMACDTRNGRELVEDPCMPLLLCEVPISVSADLEAVATRLEQLNREYREVCGSCPTAMCVDPIRVFSTCEDATCELNVAPPIEAFSI